MNRSPLFYPLNRGMDAEGGGAAELQTDVMRFMAIISMCLVAIFALVQSIPLAPNSPAKTVDVRADPADEAEPEAVPEPVMEPATERGPEPVEQTVTLTRPKPAVPRPMERPVPLQRPAPKVAQAPEPIGETPRSEPQPEPATPKTPERKGFTLRFESDAVLTRLVKSEAVNLYVIGSNETRRLHVESGRISFWSSSTPDQFHEMDSDTVPANYVNTWQRQHGNTHAAPRWAVSLPPAMSRQLRSHLASSDGGSLVIGANEQVRLEQ